MDFRITGADELTAVARRVITAGDRGLTKEFRAGLNRAAQPATQAARTAARTRLPHRGGLADRVAGGAFTAKVTATARTAVLTVTVDSGLDLPALDEGQFRHPVYGNRTAWVEQRIPARWFTDAMEKESERVVNEVVEAAFEMLDRL